MCFIGIELIAVVLNDCNDWFDSKMLLNYGFSQFKEYELKCDVSNLKVKVLSELENELVVDIEKPFKIFLTKEVAKTLDGDDSRIQTKIDLPEYRFAPISSGDELGELEYYLDGNFVGYVKLIASKDVLY